MDLWHKLRRASWSLIPPLFKLHKSVGGGGCGGGRVDGGAGDLLKLRDDVEMCGYRDVEVMWNMLNRKQTQRMEGRGRVRVKVKVKHGKRSSKQRPVWRIFFWTNHSP